MLRIKDICKEKGLELKTLSEMYGTSYQSLFNAMNGNPTIETLKKIADLLEVPITELFEKPNKTEAVCPHCQKKIFVVLQ